MIVKILSYSSKSSNWSTVENHVELSIGDVVDNVRHRKFLRSVHNIKPFNRVSRPYVFNQGYLF